MRIVGMKGYEGWKDDGEVDMWMGGREFREGMG